MPKTESTKNSYNFPHEEKSGQAYSKKALYLALGHFATDLYPGFLPALLPLLIEKFQFSFTRASLLGMVMSFSTSLAQPLFGYVSDKVGGRWLVIFGPAVAGICLSLLGLANSYLFLASLLVIGGLGVASYHPEAAALSASLSGRQRTLGMSLFMLGGNLGVGLGPFLILGITLSLGLDWSFLSSPPALIMAWILYRHAPLSPERSPTAFVPRQTLERSTKGRRYHLIFLLTLVVLRVMTAASLTAFLPTIQRLRGFSLIAAGSSFTVFMACGAVGGVTGGIWSDRLGRKRVIVASFLFIIPAFLGFLLFRGPLSFFILALLGFLFFFSEPACIVLAQEMAPQRARTASGLVMGMAWGMAGWGVLATGTLADLVGIERALSYLLLLPAGGLALSFFLPRK
jgi:FSR family fosmidomycin resistance protein-like MFS transporter